MHPFNCSLVVMIAITGPSLLGATAYYARSSPQVSTSCQVTVTCGHWHISPNGHQVPVGLLLRTALRLWLLESKKGFLGMIVYFLRFLLFPPVWPSRGLVSPGGGRVSSCFQALPADPYRRSPLVSELPPFQDAVYKRFQTLPAVLRFRYE